MSSLFGPLGRYRHIIILAITIKPIIVDISFYKWQILKITKQNHKPRQWYDQIHHSSFTFFRVQFSRYSLLCFVFTFIIAWLRSGQTEETRVRISGVTGRFIIIKQMPACRSLHPPGQGVILITVPMTPVNTNVSESHSYGRSLNLTWILNVEMIKCEHLPGDRGDPGRETEEQEEAGPE